MIKKLKGMKNSRYIIWSAKLIISLIFIVTAVRSMFLNGLKPYYSYEGTRHYLSVGSIFELCFNILFLSVMVFAICFSIFKFENIYTVFKSSEVKQGFWYAVFFSISFVLIYNPLASVRNEATNFKRIIGAGFVANVDVSRRINNFSYWFIILSVTFIFFFLLSNYFLQKEWEGENRKIIDFLDNLIVVADVNLVLKCITYFQDQNSSATVFYYSTNFIVIVMLSIFAYVALKFEQIITVDIYAKLMMIGFSMAYSIAFVFTSEFNRSKILLGVQILLFTFCIVFIKFGKDFFREDKVIYVINGLVIFSSTVPFITSFYIELINILNQHGVALSHMRRKYIIMILTWYAISCLFSFIICRKQWNIIGWKKWSYPWIIYGISCLSVQISLEMEYNAHLFETANRSILISDFLNFGSIPIVEHYGGHMMSGVWEGLIYAVLNNDYKGAIFSPYSGYIVPVCAVLFFCFVKYVWNEDAALFATLFFPFSSSWGYFGLGMLVCVAINLYLKKNTYSRALLMWLAVIWCILYRLDLGFAYGSAGSIALLIYVLMYKNWKAAKQLLISLAAWGFVGGTTWFIICFIKGVSPIKRLLEFLVISASNINWAYETIGNMGSSIFAWAYIFIPFTMVFGLIYTLFSEKLRRQTDINCWIILLVMELAYFTNFSRGLVRHSMAENSTAIVMWTGYVCIAALFGFLKNNKKLFLPIFMICILCNRSFLYSDNFVESSISDTAAYKMGTHRRTWSYWKEAYENGESVTRVKWEEDLEKTILPYRTVINTLLKDDETFVDFINKTFVYSALNRKNPVYVSQSPLQLSGEFAQEMFLEEIEGIPIVLMPIDADNTDASNRLDGITNAYRYYKVSEYIYQNYVPLCKYEDIFAVWCLKEKYDEMKERAEHLIYTGSSCELIEYGYDGPTGNEDGSFSYISWLHNNSIGQLPRIWAQADDAIENTIITNLILNEDIFMLDAESVIPATDGNYLLISATYYGEDIDANYGEEDEKVDAVVIVGSYEDNIFTEKYKYDMVINEGNHDYLIRISTDYYWYTGDVNAVCIKSPADLHDVAMCILQGD